MYIPTTDAPEEESVRLTKTILEILPYLPKYSADRNEGISYE